MATARLVTAGLVLSLICGSAFAAEVDQTGSLAEPSLRGMVLPTADPVPAMATLPELKVVAVKPRRGVFDPMKDKPWDPRVCIGC